MQSRSRMRVRKNTSSATLRAEKSCRRVGALDECKIERSRWAKRANTILSIRIVPIEIGSTCAELKYAVPHCRVDLVKLKIKLKKSRLKKPENAQEKKTEIHSREMRACEPRWRWIELSLRQQVMLFKLLLKHFLN